jgi:uncharacterized membrane protein
LEALISYLSTTRLISLWDRLRTSFWFLPSAMACAAIGLSYALVEVDAGLSVEAIRELGWLYSFGPEGARAVLSAIAGSMITVAGLTFSITMLTLQLASSQFGPRLLRNAMRDRGNQVVLGTFISTFAYCLLVLRTVRGTEGASSVPHLSVAVGVLLALASLGVLIYFIHHVANAIRIETVLAQLATETNAAIDQLYPERLGRDPPDDAPRAARRDASGDVADREVCIQAAESGYVKRLDTEALMRMATEHNLVVWIEARPGRFVIEQQVVLSASPSKRIPAEIADALRGTLVIGPDRSPDQDVAHALRRIVEIAQRALSPGINDPTTAIYCLDRMEEALMRLAARDVPPPTRYDKEGRLRVVTEVETLEALACPSLVAVARYALADADVISRILALIETVGRIAPAEAAAQLAALGEAIRRDSAQLLDLSYDRDRLTSAASSPNAGMGRR